MMRPATVDADGLFPSFGIDWLCFADHSLLGRIPWGDVVDPLTTAILSALSAAAANVAGSSVKDAYEALKALIVRKFGADSALKKSVDDLEKVPDSKGRAVTVSEEVAKARAADDLDIKTALDTLVSEIAASRFAASSTRIVSNISGGSVGVVGAQSVTVGSINVGSSRDQER
jgi:hypothetical protein